MRGYTDEDPGPEGQKALPLNVFRCLANNTMSRRDVFLGHLLIGALFFAMRSCEYTKTSGYKRKTKLLCVRNIKFYRRNRLLSHRDNIGSADYIAITFESQKNASKNETIIQHKNTKDLCPITSWAYVIK